MHGQQIIKRKKGVSLLTQNMSSTSCLALSNDTLLTQNAKKRRPFPFENQLISACVTGNSKSASVSS